MSTAWLVETQKHGPILYYNRDAHDLSAKWTRDPNMATRFHSRSYAETVAEQFAHHDATAAEHEWPEPKP